QDGYIAEQAVSPGKLEEGINEDQNQPGTFDSQSAGGGLMSIGSALNTSSASFVDRNSASAAPTASRLVDAKKAVPLCSDAMICMSTIRVSRSSMRRTHTSR